MLDTDRPILAKQLGRIIVVQLNRSAPLQVSHAMIGALKLIMIVSPLYQLAFGNGLYTFARNRGNRKLFLQRLGNQMDIDLGMQKTACSFLAKALANHPIRA